MSDLEAKEVVVDAKEYYDMRHELCEYHMLEKELGIDLITLFSILKNGYRDIDGRFYSKVYLDVEEKELFEIADIESTYFVSSLSQCNRKEL